MGGFTARRAHDAGVIEHAAWRLKWYEMTASDAPIVSSVRHAADQQVRATLDDLPGAGVGFALLHVGAEAVRLLCDTWHADVLHHSLWRAELSRPDRFEPVAAPRPTACVHELAVVAHERDSYVNHVLDASSPDFDGYLDDAYGSLDQRRRRVLLDFDASWRAANVDALMSLMTDEPRYGASLGPGPGELHEGAAAVRLAFETVMRAEAAAAAQDSVAPPLTEEGIWLDGDRALTRWQYASADEGGRPVVVHGVDLWEFDGVRLSSKDAYRKAGLPAGS